MGSDAAAEIAEGSGGKEQDGRTEYSEQRHCHTEHELVFILVTRSTGRLETVKEVSRHRISYKLLFSICPIN